MEEAATGGVPVAWATVEDTVGVAKEVALVGEVAQEAVPWDWARVVATKATAESLVVGRAVVLVAEAAEAAGREEKEEVATAEAEAAVAEEVQREAETAAVPVAAVVAATAVVGGS